MPEILVYGHEQCAMCKCTADFLTSRGIPFAKIDVTKDADAMDRVLSHGKRTLPFVETPSAHWYGHRPDMMLKLSA